MKTDESIEVKKDDEKWVNDSSVDHKGRIPSRASTGVWRAASFIIAIEFSERMSYFGLLTSLMIYLTKVIHQDLKTAAKSVNYWSSLTALMPLFGGFLADAYLGRFYTVVTSSIIYLLGLGLLTMSCFVPSLKACGTPNETCNEPRKVHVLVFFLAIYLISFGTGGHKPSVESFGADQFDDNHVEERKQKMSYFNWWNCAVCSGLLLSVTVIVYVQDHIGWGAFDIILTTVMAFSLIVFIIGTRVYRYRVPRGSPLSPMLQVVVAAFAKRNLPYPSNPAHLYEVSKSEKPHERFLFHTTKLKFLDKAAILEENSTEKKNPWRLATVTKVEEMKLLLNMIPIWISTLPFGMCVAQSTTFFIKQATTLNRDISGFSIPSSSVFSLSAIGTVVSLITYDKILVPILRKATGNERGITILQRIGIGMIFSIATMVVAALVERKRLDVVKSNPTDGSLSMSVFWLAPQFLIIGVGDGFTLVGLQEYFYDQVPDSMRSLGIAFYLSVIGGGSFLSNVLITITDKMSEKGGKSWFGKNLNNSRLDNFYLVLVGITSVNLFMYVLLAKRYTYKSVQSLDDIDSYEGDKATSMA